MKKLHLALFLILISSLNMTQAQLTPFQDSATHLYGYRNSLGQTIVTPQYNMANTFVEGRAAVNKGGLVTNVNTSGGKWGFIDSTGAVIIPLEYDFVQHFKQDTARVVKDRKRLLIDKNGKTIDPTKYYKITQFDTPIDWKKKN